MAFFGIVFSSNKSIIESAYLNICTFTTITLSAKETVILKITPAIQEKYTQNC